MSMKHGLFKDGSEPPREYWIWVGIRQRCKNPNNWAFSFYGGRGIALCDRWEDPVKFLEDMGPRPTSLHSIDRIDNDGDYSPSNCRWATKREQTRNRDKTIRVDGMTIPEIASALGMSYHGVYARIARGWSIDDIASKPRGDGVTRSTNRLITARGRTQTSAEWAREIGITKSAISARLKAGWSDEEAVLPRYATRARKAYSGTRGEP